MKVVTKVEFNHLPQIAGKIRANASREVQATAHAIEATTKELMQEAKSGEEYPRPGGKTHLASAPGEAPAVDYGHLINSIQVAQVSDLMAVVYTNAESAEHLEFGTTRMEARPFFTPAAEQHLAEFLNNMKRIAGA